MAASRFVASLVLFCAVTATRGLKCNEGFNMSLNGIPLYYWAERECSGDSKCFGQEFALEMNLAGPFRTALRYGACVSSPYANYLDCHNLFGEDSSFDPADLLDLVPGIETSVNEAVSAFSQDISASLLQLLSNGTGTASFVDGVFIFYENLGYNLAKAVPLKPSLVKLLSVSLNYDVAKMTEAVNEFFNALANLDTAHEEFASAIRTLLTNIGVNVATDVDAVIYYKTLIDRLPGLLRSVFPLDWQVEMWYDVAFKLAGNVDPANWTKTAENMVATIKNSYEIPNDVGQYVNPILDAIPDLVRGSMVNPAYAGNWSLGLLEGFSEEDAATHAFSTSLLSFLEMVTNSTLEYEYRMTIKWMPGLFYQLFPGDKAVIRDVYKKMADGFNTFDFTDLEDTAPETKLSSMIKSLLTKFGGGSEEAAIESNPLLNALVVNFAHMFYDLMNVTDDYTDHIDTFSTIIEDGFKNWPSINVGQMIGELIEGFDGAIPDELKPLLDNLQPILTAAIEQPLDLTKLINALYGVTDSYKEAYPESPFPELVKEYIDVIVKMLTLDWLNDPEAAKKSAELSMALVYWNIDLQFAIIKSYNYTNDQLHHMMVHAWPDYALYIRVLQAMEPDDVKQLVKDVIAWTQEASPTAQSFVDATKPTFQKISASIESLMKEVRQAFKPNSCKFGMCETDLCNTQEYISSKEELTMWSTTVVSATTATATSTSASTTSGATKLSSNMLQIVIFGIAAKLFL